MFTSSRSVPLLEHTHVLNEGTGHLHPLNNPARPFALAGGNATGGFDKPAYNFAGDLSYTELAVTGATINNAGTAGATMNFAVKYVDMIVATKS
jgi:hypothetical protein